MKIQVSVAEFRALVLQWEISGGSPLTASRRVDILEGVASQVDPVELFILEATDETPQTFLKLSAPLQFCVWLFRNDIDSYNQLRSISIKREMHKRVRAEKSGGI